MLSQGTCFARQHRDFPIWCFFGHSKMSYMPGMGVDLLRDRISQYAEENDSETHRI
jgi:hypothetical protein